MRPAQRTYFPGARWLLLASLSVVAACGITPPARTPDSGPVVEPATPATGSATTTPLQQDSAATSPWDYIALARQSSGAQRQRHTLDAITGFLDLGQAATARTLIEQLRAEPLPRPLQVRAQVLLARSYFLEWQYERVESTLQPLAGAGGLDADNAAQPWRGRAAA